MKVAAEDLAGWSEDVEIGEGEVVGEDGEKGIVGNEV